MMDRGIDYVSYKLGQAAGGGGGGSGTNWVTYFGAALADLDAEDIKSAIAESGTQLFGRFAATVTIGGNPVTNVIPVSARTSNNNTELIITGGASQGSPMSLVVIFYSSGIEQPLTTALMYLIVSGSLIDMTSGGDAAISDITLDLAPINY